VIDRRTTVKLRAFVCSPDDVNEERRLVANVLDRLELEFTGQIQIERIMWEHEPLRATATFQEELVRPSEADVFICIVWARIGSRLPTHMTRKDGSTYESGTVYEFEDAYDSFQRIKRPDMLVYRKTARPVVEIDVEDRLRERLEQKRSLDVFLKKWFVADDGTAKGSYHRFESPADFERLVEIHLRKLIQRRLDAAAHLRVDEERTVVRTRWQSGSPYRGLQTFEFDHSRVFCGRTAAVSEVLNALRRQAAGGVPFVLITGPSGGGKSSLARAGVLPAMTHPGVIEGCSAWRRVVFRPSDASTDLLSGLAAALSEPAALPELRAELGNDAALVELLRSPSRAAHAVQRTLKHLARRMRTQDRRPEQHVRLALLLDQLEEVFTVTHFTDEQRKEWVNLIVSLVRTGVVWVVGTLRSDLYARLSSLPELAALANGGHYELRPPVGAEIAQMISQPAAMAGLRFEVDADKGTGLDEAIREAAERHPEALPLLEFTLDELHKRCATGLLTFEAYRALGGLEGALAHRAESVYSQLPPDVQAAFSPVMMTLVTVALGSPRRLVRKRPLASVACASQQRQQLVDAFVKARLFVADRNDEGASIVSVAHEALLEHWPRVTAWAAENEAHMRLGAQVAAGATIWHERHRNPEFLLPLSSAREAVELLHVDRRLLGTIETAYLHASVARADRHRMFRRTGLLGAAGVAGACALVYSHLCVWDSVEYHGNLDWRNGVPHGVDPISSSDVAERHVSYRLTYRGAVGPLVRLEAINSRGRCSVDHTIRAEIGNDEQQRHLIPCRWELEYSADGRTVIETAYDRLGATPRYEATSNFSSDGAAISTSFGAKVAQYSITESRSRSGANFVKTTLDADGRTVRRLYERASAAGTSEPASEVDGSFGDERTYDADGRGLRLTALDRDGKPVPLRDGVATWHLLYDDRHNQTAVRKYGLDGKPVLDGEGVHGWDATFDAHGNEVARAFVDVDGKPTTLANEGYAVIRSTFERGDLVRTLYFDGAGKPARNREGCHGWAYSVDEEGDVEQQTCLGVDDKPQINSAGFVASKLTIGPSGATERVTFVDAAGKPVRTRSGYAGWSSEFDEAGREKARRFHGESEGQRLFIDGAYQAWTCTHGPHGEMDRTYQDADGQPAHGRDDCAGYTLHYDGNGRVDRVDHHGDCVSEAGNAALTREYDAEGNLLAETLLDERGQPTPGERGYATIKRTYDEISREKTTCYHAGNERVTSDGVHCVDSSHDAQGFLVRQTYRGLPGAADKAGVPYVKPGSDGYAIVEYDRDCSGNPEGVRYFDEHHNPIRNGAGYHRKAISHDVHGREVAYLLFDEHGQPTVSADGYHRYVAEYDEVGHKIGERYFDAAQRPAAVGDGHVRKSFKVDAFGNTVQTAYFDAHDQPVAGPDGCPVVVRRHDADHRVIETQWLADGAPCAGYAGIARIALTRDPQGGVTQEALFDASNRPAGDSDGCQMNAYTRDKRGRKTEERCLTAAGTPFVTSAGWSTKRYTYGFGDDPASIAYVDGAEVLLVEKRTFDGTRVVAIAYEGADGKPRENVDGVARVDITFDPSSGRRTREERHKLEKGAFVRESTTTFEYDRLGRVVREQVDKSSTRRAYDAWGRVVVEQTGTKGPELRYEYDVRGRRVAMRRFAGDVPTVDGDGVHRESYVYDARGLMTESLRYGRDDRKISGTRFERDAQSRVVREITLGSDHQPDASAGFSSVLSRYNEKGQLVAIMPADADGNRVFSSRVVREVRYEYDRLGRRSAQVVVDSNGREQRTSLVPRSQAPKPSKPRRPSDRTKQKIYLRN
jgi:hypothetical protein